MSAGLQSFCTAGSRLLIQSLLLQTQARSFKAQPLVLILLTAALTAHDGMSEILCAVAVARERARAKRGGRWYRIIAAERILNIFGRRVGGEWQKRFGFMS